MVEIRLMVKINLKVVQATTMHIRNTLYGI